MWDKELIATSMVGLPSWFMELLNGYLDSSCAEKRPNWCYISATWKEMGKHLSEELGPPFPG